MIPISIFIALSVGVIVVLVVFVRVTRIRFVIDVQEATARVRRGDPPAAFVRACSEVARMHRFARGRVTGLRTGSGIELRFSPDIPLRAHQPLRNAWIPPTSGGPGGAGRAAG